MIIMTIRKAVAKILAICTICSSSTIVHAEELNYRLTAQETEMVRLQTGETVVIPEGKLVIMQRIINDNSCEASYLNYRGIIARSDLKYIKVFVNADPLNLRKKPVDGDVICEMPIGTQIYIISENEESGWNKVLYNDNIGYCSAKYLSTKHVIGSYSTPLSNNSNNVNNIRVASNFVNGIIVKKGTTFSYLDAIGGESKAEDGYLPADIIVNGKRVKGMGGGVCQVSSTHDAAIKSIKDKIIKALYD